MESEKGEQVKREKTKRKTKGHGENKSKWDEFY